MLKKLEEVIKSQIHGNFLKGLLALLEKASEYEAKCTREALKGIAPNEKVYFAY